MTRVSVCLCLDFEEKKNFFKFKLLDKRHERLNVCFMEKMT